MYILINFSIALTVSALYFGPLSATFRSEKNPGNEHQQRENNGVPDKTTEKPLLGRGNGKSYRSEGSGAIPLADKAAN